MADITLPPVDVTNWTDWYKLWAYANRLNLLAGKTWDQPTDAETYKALVTIINDALNGTNNGSLLPAVGQTSTLLPAVAEGFQPLIAVTPTDPTAVGTISAQPIEGIVTGGGAIGSVIATVSGGSYGAVKRSVAALTAASILATTIGAFQMAQEKVDDLVTSLDPFVDDDDNVITYTDEDGKTYLPHDVIEAVRQKMIEMGVYQSGTEVIPISSNVTIAAKTTTNQSSWGSFTVPKSYYQAFIDCQSNSNKKIYYDESNGVARYIKEIEIIPYFTTSAVRATLPVKNTFILRSASNVANFKIFMAIDLSSIPTYSEERLCVYYYNLYDDSGTARDQIGSLRDIMLVRDPNDSSKVTGIVEILAPDQSYVNNHLDLYSDFATTTVTLGSVTLTDSTRIAGFAYLNSISGDGVEGVSIQEGATVPSDPNQTLEDYFPTWTSQGKVFNTIKKGVDGTIESIGETTFLPATLQDVQPIEEGTTMTQAQAQDGTAQDNPDITNQLLPAIQELLEKIINSPDIPTPTIPAGDSGDTPPAEPPVISANANGLWDIYNPTLTDVRNFGAWLWSSNILDQITRMFNSPIDAVIGFHMIYCTPVKGSAKNIVCGYLDSGVQSTNTVANQYTTIDCGTVFVPEYYGTVLDYVATKLALYLPFIGIVPLDTAVCMGSTLRVIYRIDVLTGTCLAQVKVIKENSEAVMYTFAGNCSVQIPLTATTYTGTVSALIGIANTAISVALDNPYGVISGARQTLGGAVEGAGTGGVKQSGGLGSNAGALGIRIPYLIITHPAAYDALMYNTQYGYPLNQSVTLGDMSGYTKVKNIHLAGIPCTDDELEQIETLLKEGVIFN